MGAGQGLMRQVSWVDWRQYFLEGTDARLALHHRAVEICELVMVP